MRLLVCLDGEPHTRGAIERAIDVAINESAEPVGVHVIDQWLRQFSTEIYAQGRKEYLEWVDRCLEERAAAIREEFAARCHSRGVRARFVLRDGDPFAEILALVGKLEPELVITGEKTLTRWGRVGAGKLPRRLRAKLGRRAPNAVLETVGPRPVVASDTRSDRQPDPATQNAPAVDR